MYNMYPDYAERGPGRLGHYNYPVYEKPNETSVEVTQTPETQESPSPKVGRGAGYISVKEMVSE